MLALSPQRCDQKKGAHVIFHRELRPGRDVAITFAAFGLAALVLALTPHTNFFVLHPILDTSACLVSAGVALLLSTGHILNQTGHRVRGETHG